MATALPRKPNSLGAAYPVQLAIFEGPLELLLSLIEREELDINEVSLVAVTDSYLRALEALEERISPESMADFLVVASRLIFLKSRSLLPRPQSNEEDEEEDPGDALVRQLLEYRQFKEVAAQLQNREAQGLRAYVRTAPLPKLERKLDLGGVELAHLARAVQRVLHRMPSTPPMPTVRTYTVTVAEQIERVRGYIQQATKTLSIHQPIRFTALLSQGRSRMEVIVTFLAVLELIKRREITVQQEEIFGEIVLAPALPEEQTTGATEEMEEWWEEQENLTG